jgi:hypothetical protein
MSQVRAGPVKATWK